METHGEPVSGHMHYCKYCYVILASDRWLASNTRQPVLRNMRNSVFDGVPAGYKCPSCQGEMVKGPVQIEGRDSIELDGCLKCGSLWFDNREIEPFFPEIQDLGLFPESGASKTTKSAIAVLDTILSGIIQGEKQILGWSKEAFFGRKNGDSEE